jgi:hypothetical protein
MPRARSNSDPGKGEDAESGGAPAVVVCVRVRPMLEMEINDSKCIECINNKELTIQEGKDLNPRPFVFDAVLNESSSQDQAYEATGKPILLKAVQGYNGTIFAYGQTGSGKTYTMLGSHAHGGLIHHLADHLFKSVKELQGSVTYTITASYLQIYQVLSPSTLPFIHAGRMIHQETLLDLLALHELNSTGWRAPNSPQRRANDDPILQQRPPADQELSIREDRGLKGIYVENAIEEPVASTNDILSLLERGDRRRVVGTTNMNQQSSRSHAIFTLRLTIVDANDERRMSKISLVDLAGSERQSKTGAEGHRLREVGVCALCVVRDSPYEGDEGYRDCPS